MQGSGEFEEIMLWYVHINTIEFYITVVLLCAYKRNSKKSSTTLNYTVQHLIIPSSEYSADLYSSRVSANNKIEPQ